MGLFWMGGGIEGGTVPFQASDGLVARNRTALKQSESFKLERDEKLFSKGPYTLKTK